MSDSSIYKPTEHGGLKEDGSPDKRVGTGEFAYGKVDPVEAGVQGGLTNASSTKTTSGTESTGFAHGKVDPHVAGAMGGHVSHGTTQTTSTERGSIYKPTEHGGLKEDGTPDQRVKANTEEEGYYKPTEHGGLKEDGTPDQRVKDNN